MSPAYLLLHFKNVETSAIVHVMIFQCQTIVKVRVLRDVIAQMVRSKMIGECAYQ